MTGAPPAPAPRDENEPIFDEPWQADAFATTQALLEAGVITSAEWTTALASAIAARQRAGDPDTGDTYYEHWLVALEAVCEAKELASPDELNTCAEQWRRAYVNTPHGHPVEFAAGSVGS